MERVVILGAGKIGSAIAKHLHHTGDYEVIMGDFDQAVLDRVKKQVDVRCQQVDVHNREELVALLRTARLVVSACSYYLSSIIAEAALEAGCSYFDLTEDVATTQHIRSLADRSAKGQVFMPQCGLAPGFIGILSYHLCGQFDELKKVKMRVGALPLYPTNMMMYNLTWSTDGLINEYCNSCDAIRNGVHTKVLPLEGIERFSMDGIDYEAFNTSGGLGTLCETLASKVDELDYKTVRYQGHCYLMAFLTQSLKLGQKRTLLKEILEDAVPITLQDVVLVFSSVSGMKNGQLTQVTDARKIYHQELYGEPWSSIQITTASSLCSVIELFLEGKLADRGFVRQEQVDFQAYSENRFGQWLSGKEI